MLGDHGVFDHLKEGTIIIDHSTTSADLAIKLNQVLAKKGSFYLDAPISGGEEGARYGPSIMPGGNPDAWFVFLFLKGCISLSDILNLDG